MVNITMNGIKTQVIKKFANVLKNNYYEVQCWQKQKLRVVLRKQSLTTGP